MSAPWFEDQSAGASSGGTVTSVAGGVGVTNTPEPIVGAGTVDLDVFSLTTEASPADGDWLPFVDVSVGTTPAAQRKATLANLRIALGSPTGSGTATRVAFWSSASVLASDAALYWDDVNKRLALGGFTAPAGVLDARGVDATLAQVVAFSATDYASVRVRRSAGTFPTTPGAVLSGTTLGAFEFAGDDGSLAANPSASVEAQAEQAFTGSAHGTSLRLYTTPLGSTTSQLRVLVRASGELLLGTTSAPSAGELLNVRGHANLLQNAGAASELRLGEPDESGWSAFKAQNQAATLTYTLPASITTDGFLKTTGAGALSWALVTAAEVASGAALTRVDDTNVTLALGGSPASALLAATSLTLGWAGQLALSRGGTAADLSATGGAKQYVKQASAGGAFTVGAIPIGDIAAPGLNQQVIFNSAGDFGADPAFKFATSASTTQLTLAAAATVQVLSVIQNTDSAGVVALFLKTPAGGTGDTTLWLQANSVNWVAGIDNSDSQKFKVSRSAVFGTSDVLQFDASTTRGDLLVANSSAIFSRVAVGAAGRYWRSDGTDPSWTAATANDDFTQYTKLAGRTGTTNDTTLSTTVGGALYGSSAASQALSLQSTSHATRGLVNVVDELRIKTSNATLSGVLSTNSLMRSTGTTSISDLLFASILRADGTLSCTANPFITLFSAGAVAAVFGEPNLIVERTNAGAMPQLIALQNGVVFRANGAAVTGANEYGFNHVVSYDIASGGTLTGGTDITVSSKTIVGTGVALDNKIGLSVLDSTGAGTITNQVGVDVVALTKGGTLNCAFRSAVAAAAGRYCLQSTGDAQSYHKGSLRLGDTTDPTALLDLAGKLTASSGGLVTRYNNIATVLLGVPSEVAKVDLTAQSAAVAATTIYAVPAAGAGLYRVSWVASVTTAATTSSSLGGAAGLQLTYTDNNDSVVKTSNPTTPTISAGNTTATSVSGSFVAFCKASTNLQYAFGYTSVGVTAMQYNLHITVESL